MTKLGEIVVHMDNYNFTKFHQNWMKNKKVLSIATFSVQNFKVSVESGKSYIVRDTLGRRRRSQRNLLIYDTNKSHFGRDAKRQSSVP